MPEVRLQSLWCYSATGLFIELSLVFCCLSALFYLVNPIPFFMTAWTRGVFVFFPCFPRFFCLCLSACMSVFVFSSRLPSHISPFLVLPLLTPSSFDMPHFVYFL